jgi:hypothetical protein
MCFLAFYVFVLAAFTVSFILRLPVSGRNRAAREDVPKFAICFLPLSVTAGWQPSQAAAVTGCLAAMWALYRLGLSLVGCSVGSAQRTANGRTHRETTS